MIKELSVLIPVYNDNPVSLVKVLSRQAMAVEGLDYEILVIDDGSTDKNIVEHNSSIINSLPFCRYVIEKHHDCRSSMRNDMVRHGKYEWHLMVDARLEIISDDFLLNYLDSGILVGEVACGGIIVEGGRDTCKLYKENLRFRYEKSEEKNHSWKIRSKYPYKSFRTTNFFYHRTVLEKIPYDERIKGYGYEDVMLGKNLENAHIVVHHIDNPVAYTCFESNSDYLKKIEEAMFTLNDFSNELKMYSPLLRIIAFLNKCHILWIMRLWHRLFSKIEYRQLCSDSPSLFLFKLYKLGFLVNISS